MPELAAPALGATTAAAAGTWTITVGPCVAMDEYSKKRMRNEAVAKLALCPKNTLENAIAANAIVLFSVEKNTLRFRTHCYIHWAS
jgi:hypothetical protein